MVKSDHESQYRFRKFTTLASTCTSHETQADCRQIDEPTQGRYNVGISAIIRIILRDGTFHEDTGYGQCDNTKGKGAALDKVRSRLSSS
jgi:recombination DNA repair RAD52 pathway protein